MTAFQQVSIFTFDPDQAHWEPLPWSTETSCQVLALIPESVLDPYERGKVWPGSNEWDQLQDHWSGYVYAIAKAIPQFDRSADDVNGWIQACKMLVESRDLKRPIEIVIHSSQINRFIDAEIIEYLSGGG